MGQLVLLRHGESVWNAKGVLSGWVDIPLSAKGIEQAKRAGESLANIAFGTVYTSCLWRSISTAAILMAYNQHPHVPIETHIELNERYYGRLQSYNIAQLEHTYSKVQVHQWRKAYDVSPPQGESLKTTAQRIIPFFEAHIKPRLQHENLLMVLHGTCMRALLMHINKLDEEEVSALDIPNAKPIVIMRQAFLF